MTAVLQYLESIINLVKAVFNFIIDEISSLVNIITKLPEYLSYLSQITNIFPSFLTAFAGVFVACMLLIMITRWLHG